MEGCRGGFGISGVMFVLRKSYGYLYMYLCNVASNIFSDYRTRESESFSQSSEFNAPYNDGRKKMKEKEDEGGNIFMAG